MKHQLKITLHFEIDTEHPDYDGPQDIDQIVEKAEETLRAVRPENECGYSLHGIHMEVVE